jgi:hypothetical protein
VDQIPEGYCVVHVQVGDGLTVYINPVKGIIRGEQRPGG